MCDSKMGELTIRSWELKRLNGARIGDATYHGLHEGILCPIEIQYF